MIRYLNPINIILMCHLDFDTLIIIEISALVFRVL